MAQDSPDCIEVEHTLAEDFHIAGAGRSVVAEVHHTDADCTVEHMKTQEGLDSSFLEAVGGREDTAGKAGRWCHSNPVQILGCYLRRKTAGCSLADTLQMSSRHIADRTDHIEAAVEHHTGFLGSLHRPEYVSSCCRCFLEMNSVWQSRLLRDRTWIELVIYFCQHLHASFS